MDRLGIGVIGLGRHGLRYARHLLEPLRTVRLAAVCRRDRAQGTAFAEAHGVPFHADYRELIRNPDVDAVAVVTPPSQAPAICLAAVQARKPVLIEKPLAVTAQDARAMVQAAADAGVSLMTAQTLRFDRAVLALKEGLPTVGSRRYAVLTMRLEPRVQASTQQGDYGGRGVMLEIGIHLLDLVRFLTNEEVMTVRCDVEPPSGAGGEPRALAVLQTAGGFACVVDVSRVSRGRVARAEWIGDQGQLLADWAHHRLRRVSADQRIEEWAVPEEPTLPAILEGFAGAILRGEPVPVTGEDGLRAVELAEACYQSAASGREVRLPQN
ncbi:MAG: Gfo/Idh/MocA family protein [Nitrospirales bacterium]